MVTVDPTSYSSSPNPRPPSMDNQHEHDWTRAPQNMPHSLSPRPEQPPDFAPSPHGSGAFDMHQLGDAMETNPFRAIQKQRTGQSPAHENPWQDTPSQSSNATHVDTAHNPSHAFSPLPSPEASRAPGHYQPPPQQHYETSQPYHMAELPAVAPLERTFSNSSVDTVSTDNTEGREEKQKELEETKRQEVLLNDIYHGRTLPGPSVMHEAGMTEAMNEDDELLPGLPPRPKKEILESEPPIAMEDREAEERQTAVSAPAPTEVSHPIPQETYQIKHIRYWDSGTNNLKEAAILMQNENGPCPLIALVNVLTMSQETLVLADALRLREQLSLELLLSVVCEELVLRGSYTSDLTELHKFLLDLRRGMNVNPQFIGDEITAEDFLNGHNIPAGRALPRPRPGTFVHTREMDLYNAFNIPLVHGWLPAPTSPWFAVLVNHARSFETAQDLILQQQFIIERTTSARSGMTEDESNTVSRASEVQLFLEASATQLTPYGYDVLAKYLPPGSWSIFFRNDHFGALYKHPVTSELYTLVTDQGYSSYEEIVWESLVDGTGRGGSYFSGDFRPVGQGGQATSTSQPQAQSMLDPDLRSTTEDGWEVVQPRRPRVNQSTSPATRRPPAHPSLPNPVNPLSHRETSEVMIPAGDTTDYDLALALHLQQEEDDEADRQRRSSVSNTVPVSGVPRAPHRQSSRYQPPPGPPSAALGPVPVPDPPAVPSRRNPEDVDPPPRYERVQSSGPGSPTWQPQMTTATGRNANADQTAAYAATSGGTVGMANYRQPDPGQSGSSRQPPERRRRTSASVLQQQQQQQMGDKEKCCVM